MLIEPISRMLSLWDRLVWQKWKYFMLAGALLYIILTVAELLLLGLEVKEPSYKSSYNTKKPNKGVPVEKFFSEWEGAIRSKIMKNDAGYSIPILGTRLKDLTKYFPNSNGKFTCLSTKQEIDFIKVNDDYCDCINDGSDEPGTNACNNGVFYCEKFSKKSLVKIPSYRVNDGVCDCCDGSDEWLQISLLDASSDCKNICS